MCPSVDLKYAYSSDEVYSRSARLGTSPWYLPPGHNTKHHTFDSLSVSSAQVPPLRQRLTNDDHPLIRRAHAVDKLGVPRDTMEPVVDIMCGRVFTNCGIG